MIELIQHNEKIMAWARREIELYGEGKTDWYKGYASAMNDLCEKLREENDRLWKPILDRELENKKNI
jgi:hypothetical protein